MCYYESNIDCLKQCASDLDKFDIISHIEYLLVSIKDSIFEKPLLDNELGLKYNAVANHGQNIPSYLICKRNLSNFQTVASKLRNAITMSIVKKKMFPIFHLFWVEYLKLHMIIAFSLFVSVLIISSTFLRWQIIFLHLQFLIIL